MKNQWGFTMVELITVMILMGVLGAFAFPRFFDRGAFDSRGFHDQVVSTLRYAQKVAVAERRLVCVTFTSAQVTLRTAANFSDTSCNTDLQSPTGDPTYTVVAPSGISLSGFNDFNFSALGVPSSAQSIAVSGFSSSITVEAGTGYVH